MNVGSYGSGAGLSVLSGLRGRAYPFTRLGYYPSADEPSYPLDTLTGPYAAPRLAGRKFKGYNIVPRPTDDGNGPSLSPSVVYETIYDFLTEGATGPCWLQWIKPQIDAAQRLGCNCVRWYWAVDTLVGDAGHMIPERICNPGLPSEFTIPAVTYKGPVSWAQLEAGIDLVCTYLASKGMYYYPCATEALPVDSVTEAGLLDYIDHFIAAIVQYPNVIACDVIMEIDRSVYAATPANVATVMNRAKAARGASTLPLTCSVGTLILNNDAWKSKVNLVLGAGVEFLDAHVYIRSSWSTLMDFLFDNGAQLPIMMGEGGLTYSGEFFFNPQTPAQEITHPKSSELRAQHYQDVVAAFGRRPDLQVFTAYGVCDQWPPEGQPVDDTQLWGVHTAEQDAHYDFLVERPEWSGPFRTIPVLPPLTDNLWTLDLSGADTTAEALTTFAVGWGQLDASATFNRVSNRLKRAHSGSVTAGLINEYLPLALDQRIIVEFDAALAVASGGVINWAVGLRLQTGGADYYLISLTSQPSVPGNDGLITVVRIPDLQLLGADQLDTPAIDLAHVYRLTATAVGSFPTTITVTVEDLTAGTTAGSLTITDDALKLQSRGVTALPSQVGTVYYRRLSVQVDERAGPTFDTAPVLSAITDTSADLSWPAGVGGSGSYRYLPEYIALDAQGIAGDTWIPIGDPGGQTGLTASVSGLTPGVVYAFRVHILDDAVMAPDGALTMPRWRTSQWAQTASGATGGGDGGQVPSTRIGIDGLFGLPDTTVRIGD